MPIPDTYLAATLHKSDEQMFAGRASRDKDPRESLHIEQVPTPELAAGEALIAVMASSINYNTVWSSIFEPVSTFGFLDRYARTNPDATRHNRDYHVLGSDASGVVLQTGPGVHMEARRPRGRPLLVGGTRVSPRSQRHHDGSRAAHLGVRDQLRWLGSTRHCEGNQLLPKPEHLTWEEAACPGLVNSTAYRQLVSHNGGAMKQGDVVLIWGASGGLGSYATQYALNGGAIPVCVVSNESKAEVVRSMGADLIIDRSAEGYKFWKDETTQDPKEWQRLGKKIRQLTGGDDIDIVFEHPGRETFGASVYVTRKGGTIVTCASTSGFMHEYDNRYLWMNLKRIVGSHFANYREAHEANRLIAKGMIHPTLSKVLPLAETGQASWEVHRNMHQGKVGILCLAPVEGLGVTDPALRASLGLLSIGSARLRVRDRTPADLPDLPWLNDCAIDVVARR